MNKKRTKPWLAFAGVFLVGLFIGAEYQHFVNGHHFIVHDTKSFPFPGGEVKLLDVSEYIGIPWFEGGSVLSLETKDGLPITVYKDKSNRIDEVSTEKNR
ncbi:MAG: hypothetical protein QGH15_24140, partial [Kiritimatiellia bacterium]|nr:hypothetical protein [Kiritimatiellia bacterium]